MRATNCPKKNKNGLYVGEFVICVLYVQLIDTLIPNVLFSTVFKKKTNLAQLVYNIFRSFCVQISYCKVHECLSVADEVESAF